MSLAGFARFFFVLFILAVPSAMAAEDALSPRQKQAVEGVVRDYLTRNPEVLVEAIRALRAKQESEDRNKAQKNLASLRGELENDPTSPVGGNPRGDVTIVEFFDYRCGFCKRVFPTLMTLMKSDGNIRYAFKEFPILGPDSVVVARAALAVWKLDKAKYLAFHSALMNNRGELPERKVMKIAANNGLDVGKLRKIMADPDLEKMIRKNYQLAEALAITGTPAFIIGKRLVRGAIDLETIEQLVAEARKG
jgi:protein-disulfide isomerase